jgi:ABC-type polysaccharide transport system permease subunit
MMALLNLTLGFIAPVILGLLISQLRSKRFARGVQSVSYMPYFVSTVVCTSLAMMFLDDNGAITKLLSLFGAEERNWIAYNSPSFWFINCFLEIWQGAGYGAIIYIASISNINGDYYDAAAIDGANRWKMMTNVTIPTIMPTIIMMFTLKIGTIFMTGFDKVLLLYMPTTYEHADVLTTFTYRYGFQTINGTSISTASGLFQSVIGTILLLVSNKVSAKIAKTSVF